ncbi:MAG TPA: serine/threonine-protein kinase [Planctomycetota bacterium]
MPSSSDPERYRQLFAAFVAARQLSPEERPHYLDELRARDADLAQELERLLARSGPDLGPDDPLADTAIERRKGLEHGAVGGPAEEPEPPAAIGSFRILRRLGAGGMGVVYEAEQESPRRRVALKLIRPGLAHGESLRRFRQEAEVLGRLQHPGIAQVYEVGSCDLGRGEQPYFVMELVEGVSLLAHAEREKLGRRARAALVAALCDAVQHAHERGVVHRDLKPENVLVDDRGQPRVLDFGVARVSANDLPFTTIHTARGELVGTLTHMAPEQIEGDPNQVGPPADIYALGVIAFQLFCGRLPHEVAGLSLTAAARRITDEDAPRLGTLDRSLRGDLETIVAKALEVYAKRRYVSAAALGSDLRRYLARQPIAARPPGALYRARKFAHRHTGLVAGMAATVLALGAGMAVAWRFALAAQAREREATAVSYRHVLSSVVRGLGESPTAAQREALDEAPEPLRGWEWRHLEARLADHSLRLEGEVSRPLLATGFVDGAPALAIVRHAGDPAAPVDRIEVVDARDGRLLLAQELEGIGRALALTAAGNLVWCEFAGVQGEVVRLRAGSVSVPAGSAARRWDLGLARLECIALSADGTRVVFHQPAPPGEDETRTLVDLESEARREWRVPPRRWALSLDPGGRLLAEMLDQDLRVSALEDDVERLYLPKASGAFDPLSGLLVTCSEGFRLTLWDASRPELRELCSTRLDTAPESVSVLEPRGEAYAVDTAGRIVSFALGAPAQTVPHGNAGQLARACVWPDGARLATLALGRNDVHVWDLRLAGLERFAEHASFVYALADSPPLGLIASAGWDGWANHAGCVRVFDRSTGVEVGRLGGEHEIARGVAWLPGDGGLLAAMQSSESSPRVSCFDPLDLSPRWEIPIEGLLSMALDPVGGRIATSALEGCLSVHDAATRKELWRRELDPERTVNQVRPLVWSPDGAWLAVPDLQRKWGLLLLDGATGEEVRRWPAHPASGGQIDHLVFSPDGALLASASDDGTAALWDPRTGERVGAPLEHDAPVLAAAFHPDEPRLVTGARDGSIHVWDLDTHLELVRLEGHQAYVHDLLWTDEGQTLLSASGDGTIRRWSTRPASALERLRQEREDILRRLRPVLSLGPEPTRAARAAWAELASLPSREREIARQMLLESARGRAGH